MAAVKICFMSQVNVQGFFYSNFLTYLPTRYFLNNEDFSLLFQNNPSSAASLLIVQAFTGLGWRCVSRADFVSFSVAISARM